MVPHSGLVQDLSETKQSKLGDEILPFCAKENGLVAGLKASGVKLDEIPETKGKSVLYTDWINALWLFSDAVAPKGGAPWYYGGTPGLENTDFLVVPLCPMGLAARRLILEAIEDNPEISFTETKRNELFILMQRDS